MEHELRVPISRVVCSTRGAIHASPCLPHFCLRKFPIRLSPAVSSHLPSPPTMAPADHAECRPRGPSPHPCQMILRILECQKNFFFLYNKSFLCLSVFVSAKTSPGYIIRMISAASGVDSPEEDDTPLGCLGSSMGPSTHSRHLRGTAACWHACCLMATSFCCFRPILPIFLV